MAFGIKHDPSNPKSYHVATTCAAFIIILWPFIILRLYVRVWISRSSAIDDVFLIISGIIVSMEAVPPIAMNQLVPGRNFQEYPPSTIMKFLNWSFASAMLYTIASIFVKLSLGFLFIRLLTTRWQRYCCIALMAVCTLFNLSYFIYIFWVCGPRAKPGDFGESILNGTCNRSAGPRQTAPVYVQAALSFVTDLVLILLPIYTVAKSKMPLKLRVGIIVNFALAIAGTITSAVRLYYMYVIIKSKWQDELVAFLCGVIEHVVFIICSCLAVLRPLILRISERNVTVDETYLSKTGQDVSAVNGSMANSESLKIDPTIKTTWANSAHEVQDTNPLPNLDIQRKLKAQKKYEDVEKGVSKEDLE